MAKSKKQTRKEREAEEEYRHKAFVSLLTVKRTEPFTMICPVCGEVVEASAIARQYHWSWEHLEFSMQVIHYCPSIVKTKAEAWAVMYPQDLWAIVEKD